MGSVTLGKNWQSLVFFLDQIQIVDQVCTVPPTSDLIARHLHRSSGGKQPASKLFQISK